MALKIERVHLGSFRVIFDGEIDGGRMSAVRHGLAAVLVESPSEVEVTVPSMPTDGAGWGLLRSFSDILRARGCRVVLTDANGTSFSLAQAPRWTTAARDPMIRYDHTEPGEGQT